MKTLMIFNNFDSDINLYLLEDKLAEEALQFDDVLINSGENEQLEEKLADFIYMDQGIIRPEIKKCECENTPLILSEPCTVIVCGQV